MRLFILVFWSAIHSNKVYAQAYSLREYCPNQKGQEGATCASYAPVYTALSTQFNASKEYPVGHPSFTIFSYGFVASKMKADKPFSSRLFNNCGKYVTAEMALQVLKSTGTVYDKEFPYVCNCSKQESLSKTSMMTTISNWKEIGSSKSDDTVHISDIKKTIEQKKPVIIAIFQTDFFRKNKLENLAFPVNYRIEDKDANHVVCIIGYDDEREGGVFLVKNNYISWGDGRGFSYVKYFDMLKLIRYSYSLTL